MKKLFKQVTLRASMEKTNILIIILAIGLVLTSGILAYNIKATTIIKESSSIQERNTLSVSGDSKLTINPDQAEVYFRIQTDGKNALEAQDGNRAASNTVIGAIKAKSVDEKNIETVQYTVNRKLRYDPQTGESSLSGYEVMHILKVKTTNVENVGALVDTGVSAGANGVDTILFTLSDTKEKQVRDQALRAAGVKAKEKAETLASSVGTSLGKVISVSESNFNYIPYRFESVSSGMMTKTEPTQIQPQNLEITATIAVVYEVNQ